MGLWEFLQQWRRGRIVAGVVASILIHALVVAGMLWGLAPELTPRWRAKPGDTLIVELPRPDEPGAPGGPSATPPPARPAPVEAKPTPPAPRRPAPAPPREERRVAAAPRAAEPAPPAPRAPEPAPKASEPAPRVVEPAPPAAEAPTATEPAPRAPQPPPPPAQGPPAGAREGGERRIASLPPGGRAAPSVSDVRAALRRGAGGRGQGRGGIVGDPIPLDTPDERFQEYFEQVRQRIQDKLIYPCVKNRGTFECEYKTTSLVVHFGILKSGDLGFVELHRASEWSIYDEYSMNAIRLAQPFPPVPPALMAALPAGTTGVPIGGHFRFTMYTSLRSILH
jgi:outer membrane biosynthesis protein TonB